MWGPQVGWTASQHPGALAELGEDSEQDAGLLQVRSELQWQSWVWKASRISVYIVRGSGWSFESFALMRFELTCPSSLIPWLWERGRRVGQSSLQRPKLVAQPEVCSLHRSSQTRERSRLLPDIGHRRMSC